MTWLKLDETSRFAAADSSSGNNPGAISDITSDDWSVGKINGALRFDQTGARMTLENKLTDDFTVSFWIKTTQDFPVASLSYLGVPFFNANVSTGTDNDVAITGTRTGSLNRISVMTGSVPDGQTFNVHGEINVSTGKWVHVLVRRAIETGLVQIYIDGVLDKSTVGSKSKLDARALLEVGKSSFENRQYRGEIDQIRIYNRVLTVAECEALAHEGVPAVGTGIDAWYASVLPGLTHLGTSTSIRTGTG